MLQSCRDSKLGVRKKAVLPAPLPPTTNTLLLRRVSESYRNRTFCDSTLFSCDKSPSSSTVFAAYFSLNSRTSPHLAEPNSLPGIRLWSLLLYAVKLKTIHKSPPTNTILRLLSLYIFRGCNRHQTICSFSFVISTSMIYNPLKQ